MNQVKAGCLQVEPSKKGRGDHPYSLPDLVDLSLDPPCQGGFSQLGRIPGWPGWTKSGRSLAAGASTVLTWIHQVRAVSRTLGEYPADLDEPSQGGLSQPGRAPCWPRSTKSGRSLAAGASTLLTWMNQVREVSRSRGEYPVDLDESSQGSIAIISATSLNGKNMYKGYLNEINIQPKYSKDICCCFTCFR